MHIRRIDTERLISIIGKEDSDSLFLNKDWIRTQDFRYEVKDLKYKIHRDVYGTTNDDNEGNFEGDIDLVGLGLKNLKTQLPERIKSIEGDFNIGQNNLTTLEGSPEYVGGSFVCNENKLITLEGGPRKVTSIFYCENNELVNLKGSPKFVGGDFSCHYNPLKSLEGISEEIRGEFFTDMTDFGGEIKRTPDGKTYQLVES